MTLLDLLCDFYEAHIFSETYFEFGENIMFEIGGVSVSLTGYLTYMASLISIIAIVLFCVFIIKKIIGIIFRLFTGSSAF